MKEKYIPIDCNIYDVFTEAAVLRKELALTLHTPDGVQEITDRVVDLITENKVEYIVLATNGKHRLDKVSLTAR